MGEIGTNDHIYVHSVQHKPLKTFKITTAAPGVIKMRLQQTPVNRNNTFSLCNDYNVKKPPLKTNF